MKNLIRLLGRKKIWQDEINMRKVNEKEKNIRSNSVNSKDQRVCE